MPDNSQQRIVVAIDGLAGSGKTTISKLFAKRLGFAHLNTGLLYRAVAWLTIKLKVDPEDGAAVEELMRQHKIELVCDEKLSSRVLVDGEDVTDSLQIPEVSDATSKASAQPQVRGALVQLQREAFPGFNLVAEGRDIGTIIFPQACVKFFIVVSEAVRVDRRYRQLIERADHKLSALESKALKEQMLIEIVERDRRDSTRALAPTKAAPDAIIIDNSACTLTEVIENMYAHAVKKGCVG